MDQITDFFNYLLNAGYNLNKFIVYSRYQQNTDIPVKWIMLPDNLNSTQANYYYNQQVKIMIEETKKIL
jgi:CRISPR/Cas system-associated protein endoribonuclease Cas2